MKSIKIKDYIIQAILIFIGVLIAFAVDRWYDQIQISKNKDLFLIDQIDQFSTEREGLDRLIEHNKKLINDLDICLEKNQHIDTIEAHIKMLNYTTDFESDFSSLHDLREVYEIDAYLDKNIKKEFKRVYQSFIDINHYELNFTKIMDQKYGPFRSKYYNRHNKTYKDKSQFRSDDFLNILTSCRMQLRNKNVKYEEALERIDILVEQLEDLK